VSKASILGSAELFVKKGSDINLTCVTVTDEHQQPPSGLVAASPPGNKTPHYFTWHHNGQVNDKINKSNLNNCVFGRVQQINKFVFFFSIRPSDVRCSLGVELFGPRRHERDDGHNRWSKPTPAGQSGSS
jgi:hypothetical protein